MRLRTRLDVALHRATMRNVRLLKLRLKCRYYRDVLAETIRPSPLWPALDDEATSVELVGPTVPTSEGLPTP